jgi:hypothetical protein
VLLGMSKRVLFVLGLLVLVAVVYVIQGVKKVHAQQPGSTTTGQCQVQVVADVLNIRSSPDGKGPVVGKLNTGAIMTAQASVQNGYRKLADNRWAASQFLKPVSGSC